MQSPRSLIPGDLAVMYMHC